MSEDDIQQMNRAIFTDGHGYLPGPAQPLTVAMLRAANDEIDRQAEAVEHAGYVFRLDPDCPTGIIYYMPERPALQPFISETIPMRYSGGRVELSADAISGEPGSLISRIFCDYGADPVPPAAQEHIGALLDLARTHREQDFRDLALMVGVEREQIDALWDGTVKRLKA